MLTSHSQGKRCPSLRDPPNGRVSDGSRYVGYSATYNCSHGYRLVGVSYRVCQLNKIWSGSQPSCSRKQAIVVNRALDSGVCKLHFKNKCKVES